MQRKRRIDVNGDGGQKRKRKSNWDVAAPAAAAASSVPARTLGSVGPGGKVATLNPLTQRPYSKRYYDILKVRMNLPVYQFIDDLNKAVREHQVVVVEGETGSGKTTQIPSALLFGGFGNTYMGRKVCVCAKLAIRIWQSRLMFVRTFDLFPFFLFMRHISCMLICCQNLMYMCCCS